MKGEKTQRIATNRRARFEYELLDKLEAGMVLVGTEVKSLRAGGVNMSDAYVSVRSGEAWLNSLYIAPFEKGNRNNHEPTRPRKLLLHAREIGRLARGMEEKGLTVVPLELYFKDGIAKCRIALAKGKKLHDKRDTVAARQVKRDLDRQLKEARR